MSRPALSVVILSRGEATLEEAIRSVATQADVAEIVVSHSGPALGARAASFPELRLVGRSARSPPEARGMQACAARPASSWRSWRRIAWRSPGGSTHGSSRHRAGRAPWPAPWRRPDGPPAALASHLIQHSSRMPHVRPAPRLRFGVSYARDLLEEVGPFPRTSPVRRT